MGAAVPQVVTESSASGAQVIDGSLKFEASKTQYLNRTFGAGNRKTWTWSGWIKKSSFGASKRGLFGHDSTNDHIRLQNNDDGGDSIRIVAPSVFDYILSRKDRDTGWFHLVVACDTTDGTAGDRVKIYHNGVRQTSFYSSSNPGASADTGFNQAAAHSIGRGGTGGDTSYVDASLSNVYWIDGQALGPENFGFTDPLTGTWRPKKFSGDTTYPNNINTNFSSSLSASSGFNASYPANNAFDGNLESFASSAGGSQYLELSSSFTGVTSLRIQCAAGSGFNMEGETYTISGTGITSKVISTDGEAKSLTSISLTSTTISGIRVTSSSGLQARIVAIEINGIILKNNAGWGLNGFYLPMDGNSPIGEDKSGIVTFNDGTIWSNSLTSSSGFRGSEPVTNAFDGDTSSICSAVDNGVITFTSPVRFPSSSTIKVVVHGGNHTVTVNGGSNQTISAGSLQTVTYSNSGNATFVMTFQRATAADTGVRAIEIDGVILVDGVNGNSWTPVNFGGSVALDNPIVSGARPILNTDGGGNVARPGVFGSEVGAHYAVTVASVGGGNRYHFDGVDRPNPTLIRGATYTFDQSDSSNSTHPLRFATAADAAGSSQYTDGVVTSGTPGSAGAYTKITVPHNAPDTLHYYCTNHGGMGSSTSQITDETKADPYAWKNVLAASLVDTTTSFAYDVSNVVNSGSTTKTIVSGGAAANAAQSNFYGKSSYFSGTDHRLFTTSSSDFTYGTGDFTMEGWVYPTANNSNKNVFSTNWGANGSILITFSHSSAGGAGKFGFFDHTASNGSPQITTSNAYPINTWHHVAFVRNGTSHKFYINGIEDGSATYTATDLTRDTFIFGAVYTNGTETFSGYMSDVRVYKGVAKYTSDFVVPSTSPDILPDTPSGVSGGSKLDKVTDGAVNFSASGDKLTVSNSSGDFDFGSGDFTIESYLYMTAQSAGDAIISLYNYGANRRAWNYYHNSNDGNMEFLLSTDGSGQIGRLESDRPLPKDKWVHVAVTKASNVYRMFFDGVQVNTATVSETIFGTGTTADSVGIGDYAHTNAEPYSGFISNIRILKGTALYTANFTPPSATPLTNVTNTKLLCCQSNTSATEGAVKPGTITANGNATATNFNPFNTDINTVRGQETGYPTWNPLTKSTSTLSNGNLTITTDGGSGYPIELVNTFTPAGRGQWYWEFTLSALSGSNYTLIGMLPSDSPYIQGTSNHFAEAAVRGFYVYVGYNGSVSAYSGAATAGSATATIGVGGVVGWAYDAENGTLKCFINGVPQGTQFTNIRTDVGWLFGVTDYDNSATASYTINFGQNPFKYAPPAGFQPLNAANLRPETVITRPDHYVGVVDYTGDGNSPREIGGFEFQPDLVVYKQRSEARDWQWYDSVRGVGPAKNLSSNTTYAETANDDTQYGYTSSFNKDGFIVTNGTGGGNANIYTNKNGQTYVSWTWKAGGNKNTFNVDDVGYASAADVNMSVGSLNSSKYNTSAIWSGMMSGPSNSGVYTNLFDGTDGNSGGYEQPTDGNTLTFTPTGGITASTSIEIYVYQSSGTYAGSADITVNGTSIKIGAVQSALGTGAAGGYVNIGTTSLTTLTWSNPSSSNNDYRLMAIKVDGKILVDSNQTPPNVPSIANTGASVGTKQGFSITTFTTPGSGTFTYSHGLTQSPTFIITKARNQSYTWTTYHVSAGATKYLVLNTQGAAEPGTMWNNTTPSSSVVYGNSSNFGTSTNYVTYQWHDVPGLQKFGSFEANQNADGPFIELGFRPAVVWIKNIDNYDPPYDWVIYDNARSTINPNDKFLCANLSNQENSGSGGTDNARYVDFLSNGFKVRTASTSINLNAHTQIYCAWAEAPTVNLFGAQSNAR